MIVDINFNNIFYVTKKELICLECKDVLSGSHFSRSYRCILCRYKTNCSWSFFQHMVESHSRKTFTSYRHVPQFQDLVFDQVQACFCGFKSTSGVQLAEHLSDCTLPSSCISLNEPKLSPRLNKPTFFGDYSSTLSGTFLNKRPIAKRKIKVSNKFHLSVASCKLPSPELLNSTPHNHEHDAKILTPNVSPIILVTKLNLDELNSNSTDEKFYSFTD